jgi:RNA recognition motif-containing protein
LSKELVVAKTIFVGNLIWSATQDDLFDLFQEFGTVTHAQVIKDRETGQSRGFGFVTMKDDTEAQRAIGALDGRDFHERRLTVREAQPREGRGGGS